MRGKRLKTGNIRIVIIKLTINIHILHALAVVSIYLLQLFQDVSLEAHQERMDFVRSRIADVNLNLKSLMETSESVSFVI